MIRLDLHVEIRDPSAVGGRPPHEPCRSADVGIINNTLATSYERSATGLDGAGRVAGLAADFCSGTSAPFSRPDPRPAWTLLLLLLLPMLFASMTRTRPRRHEQGIGLTDIFRQLLTILLSRHREAMVRECTSRRLRDLVAVVH